MWIWESTCLKKYRQCTRIPPTTSSPTLYTTASPLRAPTGFTCFIMWVGLTSHGAVAGAGGVPLAFQRALLSVCSSYPWLWDSASNRADSGQFKATVLNSGCTWDCPVGRFLDSWHLGHPRPVTWEQHNLCLLVFNWAEARDGAKYLTVHRLPAQRRIFWPKVSELRLH